MLLTTPFEVLDPLHKGVRVRVVQADGTALTDVSVPGGTGWRRSASGREWRWTGPGTAAGVRGVVLVRDRELVDQLRFGVRAAGASFMDPAISAEMILYPQTLSPPVPVQCGLAEFAGPQPACMARARDLLCR